MADTTDNDLLWDYTGDESSPFLRRAISPTFSSERPCGLSRRQARYLYHSVTEAALILEAELNRDRLNNVQSSNVSSNSVRVRIASKVKSVINQLLHLNAPYILLGVSFCLVAAVVSESLWDLADSKKNHLPYVTAVCSTFSMVLVVILYVFGALKLVSRGITLSTLTISFLCSIFTFSMLYAAFFRFRDDSWSSNRTSGDNFIVTFFMMLQFSVSVFTLNAGNIQPTLWYSELAVSFQMILAYCHLVLIIAKAAILLNDSCLKTIPGIGESSNRPVIHVDADNDSLGVLDIRQPAIIETDQQQTPQGRPVVIGVPAGVVSQQLDEVFTDDDYLLSHSI